MYGGPVDIREAEFHVTFLTYRTAISFQAMGNAMSDKDNVRSAKEWRLTSDPAVERRIALRTARDLSARTAMGALF